MENMKVKSKEHNRLQMEVNVKIVTKLIGQNLQEINQKDKQNC